MIQIKYLMNLKDRFVHKLKRKLDFYSFINKKVRRIKFIDEKVRKYKEEYITNCFMKDENENLINVKETKYGDFNQIQNSDNFNIDKEYLDFIKLPDSLAVETWYLKEKKNYSQQKIEQDILRHSDENIKEFLIKIRPYGYIKDLIVCYNTNNYRKEEHFNDVYGKKIKVINKLLKKKLRQMKLKDKLKEIFYHGFPSEYSSQIYNGHGPKNYEKSDIKKNEK